MAISTPSDEAISGRRFSYDGTGLRRWRRRKRLGVFMSSGYGLFVGVMKVLLPALAAMFILLLLAWPEIDQGEKGVDLSLSELTLDRPENMSMLNARFTGFDDKERPFLVTADTASQTEDNEDLIALELPKADITLKDGAWVALTAREGFYDRELQTVDLSGQVSLYHDRGFELHTETARIDLQGGTAMSRDPVTGQGTFGTIEAEGLDYFDQGNRIVFTGPSRLLLYPEAQSQLSGKQE